DADAAHGLGAAADHEFMLAGHDLGGSKVHGIEAGGAESADLDAGDGFAEARIDRREARDVASGLADRINHAEDDVINDDLPEIVVLLQCLQRHGGERQRGELVVYFIGLAAAAWGADVV